MWCLVLSSIHVVSIYISPFWLQSRAGLHVVQLLQREHHTPRPKRLWVVHRLQAAKPGYESKVCSAQSQPLNPMEAIKAFHLLCMSFLAVLLLEEARLWSHLTATSKELSHLNYSLYMSAISFKETDVSQLAPWCQIKICTEACRLDKRGIYLKLGNKISPGTGRPKIHIIGTLDHGLLGPSSITGLLRIYFWRRCAKMKLPCGVFTSKLSNLSFFLSLFLKKGPSVFMIIFEVLYK